MANMFHVKQWDVFPTAERTMFHVERRGATGTDRTGCAPRSPARQTKRRKSISQPARTADASPGSRPAAGTGAQRPRRAWRRKSGKASQFGPPRRVRATRLRPPANGRRRGVSRSQLAIHLAAGAGPHIRRSPPVPQIPERPPHRRHDACADHDRSPRLVRKQSCTAAPAPIARRFPQARSSDADCYQRSATSFAVTAPLRPGPEALRHSPGRPPSGHPPSLQGTFRALGYRRPHGPGPSRCRRAQENQTPARPRARREAPARRRPGHAPGEGQTGKRTTRRLGSSPSDIELTPAISLVAS